MSDALELDQEDFYGRLLAAPALADVKILLQRKGVTESDIESALSVLNDRGNGKIGACILVLMPSLTAVSPDVPGPLYNINMVVQVIEQPMFNTGSGGTGLTAEQLAQQVRMLFQHFANGHGGTYGFASMEPIAVPEGQISYGVRFERQAGDSAPQSVALPTISATGSAAPATVTLACATAGAAIYYTTDGTYPSSANATASLYAAPFVQATAATIRVAAEKAGLQQSNVRQLTLS